VKASRGLLSRLLSRLLAGSLQRARTGSGTAYPLRGVHVAVTCDACHDPHASRAPKLIYASQHGPFGGRHCDECHAEPVAGEIRLNGGNVRVLCLTCHVKVGNQVADSKSPHAAFVCTDCHTPHASDYHPHLKEPREALCGSCHEPVEGRFEH